MAGLKLMADRELEMIHETLSLYLFSGEELCKRTSSIPRSFPLSVRVFFLSGEREEEKVRSLSWSGEGDRRRKVGGGLRRRQEGGGGEEEAIGREEGRGDLIDVLMVWRRP